MIIKLLLVEFNSFVPSTIVFFHDRKYLSTADEHSFTLYQDNLYITLPLQVILYNNPNPIMI